ncbi:MAG: hypothetical protein KGJ93_04840 [Patescibacteria group bacterium]|nr:hypothetical protein [Patescibacteria group bacterium]
MPEEKLIGRVSHYYDHIHVAILDLTDTLIVGQTLHFKGATDDCHQVVSQMQIDHQDIQSAKAGESVGIRVDEKLHENDRVFAVA